MTDSPRLKDKVAVITGGASGIGEVTARLFAEHGARVAICDVNDELGRKVERDIQNSGGEVMYVHADVTRADQVAALMQTTVQRWGGLDVLFNNAGVLFAEGP